MHIRDKYPAKNSDRERSEKCKGKGINLKDDYVNNVREERAMMKV